jgi:hypothetical protein
MPPGAKMFCMSIDRSTASAIGSTVHPAYCIRSLGFHSGRA